MTPRVVVDGRPSFFLHDKEPWAPRPHDDEVRWPEPSALGRIAAPPSEGEEEEEGGGERERDA